MNVFKCHQFNIVSSSHEISHSFSNVCLIRAYFFSSWQCFYLEKKQTQATLGQMSSFFFNQNKQDYIKYDKNLVYEKKVAA